MMAKSVLLRTALGFLVAPITPGLLAIVLAAPFRIWTSGAGLRELSEAIWIVGLSAVLGYPAILVFGVPLYILFRLRGWNGFTTYLATGALLGLLVYAIYALFFANSSTELWGWALKRSYAVLLQVLLTVVCGAVAAFFFWLIARPDRS